MKAHLYVECGLLWSLRERAEQELLVLCSSLFAAVQVADLENYLQFHVTA